MMDIVKLKKNKNPYLFKLSHRFEFDPNKHALVFVHIQKTGGSDFDRFLVKNLVIHNNRKACRFLSEIKFFSKFNPDKNIKKFRKFKCESGNSNKTTNHSWYFSRQTFGWSCGLHASLIQLKSCVNYFYPNLDSNNEIFYFTIIRDPVKRYLSEWKHVWRGATWIRRFEKPTCFIKNYTRCFKGNKNWQNVSLNDFMSCEFNLANNRQTRMLSNVQNGCENIADTIILNQAKENLQKISFFALNEYQYLSQKLFEKMFPKLKLLKNLTQFVNTTADLVLKNLSKKESENLIKKIQNLNSLDMELYKYAINLFFKRLNYYGLI